MKSQHYKDRQSRIPKTTELAKAWKTAKTQKEKQKYAGEIAKLLEGVIRSWVNKLNVPEQEDLIQEYNLKVMICLENYNPKMGTEFESYLYWHFKKARNLHAIKNSTVRPPEAPQAVEMDFYKDGEIKTEVRKVRVRSLSSSLNAKSRDNFDRFKEEKIVKVESNEPVLDSFEEILIFFQKKHIINDLEVDVLYKRLLENKSFSAIAEEDDLSHEAVSKRFQKALRKMKPYFMVYRDKLIC